MLRDLAYGLYSRKLRRELSGATLPTGTEPSTSRTSSWAG
jgi:hypothetical protein